MRLSLNNRSLDALREYSQKMPEVIQNIASGMDGLNAVYMSVREKVGPHAETFGEMLAHIKHFQDNASGDIEALASKLRDTADKMELYLSASTAPGGYTIGTESLAFINLLRCDSIDYNPVEKCGENRSVDEIIETLSGGDLTEGSCSSVAFAYIGNRAGYNVLDFRGGKSRQFFSKRSSIEKITKLSGVRSKTVSGKNDIECANILLNSMEAGKEYYLAVGQHAAIVRKSNDSFEYLELQHPSNGNGWHILDDYILTNRFGCSDARFFAQTSYLIESESLYDNKEFISALGYINTSEAEQKKGRYGNVR
ncbi:MAG: hypothetical protein IKF95_03250 [Firmicutes bacterium]|nr:hypothetical protein [Bacillota bacterium]